MLACARRAIRLVVAAMALALATGAAAAPRPPLLLLVTLDTTRADHCSVYGYHRPTTPALARFAAQGVLVRRAITPMPMTDPAHASILTGLHPRSHGIRMNGHPLADPSLPTLATWAHDLGYRTAAFVSRAHLLPSELDVRGFDHADGPRPGQAQRVGGETLRAASAWIRTHTGEPLFVWVHLFDPHAPYAPPAPWSRRFVRTDDRAPTPLGNTAARPPYSQRQVRVLTGLYDGEIRYADQLLAQLFALARDVVPPGGAPLIVVAGDHGETLGERDARFRYAFDHGQLLYQDVLEVPLVLHWDGVLPAGREIAGPVSLVDVAPTLFELTGTRGFATQGTSLLPQIDGRAPTGRRLAFTERRLLPFSKQLRFRSREQFAVQDGRWKLILSTPFPRTQLYDLAQDPGETRDLAGTQPAVEAALRTALEHWRDGLAAAGGTDANVPRAKEDALRALGYVE